MGLLAPWFLAGVAAVGLPIYLHLLRRHSTTPRPFSSLMFFEPRTQSSIRHRRLRYLLLLSLRMALLVLLALAFANPFITRPAARTPGGRLVLLVVDDSFSMRAGTRMNDARRAAMSVLASHRSSDPVQVMAIDAQLHALTPQTRDSATARAAVESVSAGDSRSSFAELARAVRLVADEARASIELHLFSDMQRSSMAPTFAEMSFPDTVTLVLHPVVKVATPNWTVESVTAPGQLWGSPTIQRGAKPARVQAVVKGYATPAATRTVSLLVNGKSTATKTVHVPAGGRATVEFPSLDVPYGFSRCEVRIDSADAFPNDDGYLFAVERSDPQRVLFVHATTDTRSPRYFGDALGSAAESAFVLQSVSVDQAVNLSLSKYGFVVLSNLFGLPASLENSLLGYVRDGGSVLLALGTSAAGRGRVPIVGDTIQRVHDYSRDSSGGHDRFLSVGETDRSHPSVGKTGSLSGVKFYYAVDVDPADARVVARLTDHTPLLLDKKIGEGRVLLFTSGLDNLTNDFPLHPAFVAFVEQSARYLSGAERPASARTVDSFFDLRTSREQETGRKLGVEVVDPDLHRPLSLNEAATAQSLRLTRAGFYQVRLANGREEVVGVNPDRRESSLDVVPDDVLALWRGSPKSIEPPASTGGRAPQEHEPFSVWWYIMLLVLTVALAESWLASRHLGTRREES
jgi:aerotolerance regulator-like protein/VWA domain-containing protein